MSIKTFKPTTPSRRHMTVSGFDGIDKHAKPESGLTEVLKKSAGRNSYGRITVRHRGGGEKRKYRVIDFKRDKTDMTATVLRLEYDPNRSANIALVQYEDGEKRYIIAPVGLTAGDKVVSSAAADIKPGNCLPIANIPVGTVIHNVEMHPGKGAQLVRSAGAYAQLMAKEGENAQIRMPSGEVRIIRTNCTACIGQVGNLEHENVQIGKAGRKRHMGWRPTVRGSVMNPCDHPHGGLQPPQILGPFLDAPLLAADLLNIRHQRPAVRRQGHTPPAAAQQRYPQFLLQPADGVTDAGLGEAQLLGGRRKAAALHGFQKYLIFGQVHFLASLPSSIPYPAPYLQTFLHKINEIHSLYLFSRS